MKLKRGRNPALFVFVPKNVDFHPLHFIYDRSILTVEI